MWTVVDLVRASTERRKSKPKNYVHHGLRRPTTPSQLRTLGDYELLTICTVTMCLHDDVCLNRMHVHNDCACCTSHCDFLPDNCASMELGIATKTLFHLTCEKALSFSGIEHLRAERALPTVLDRIIQSALRITTLGG